MPIVLYSERHYVDTSYRKQEVTWQIAFSQVNLTAGFSM